MTIARTAAAYGAAAASGVQVIGFLREGERVSGVRVCDRETGREFDVRARVVVNATGVWTDATQELAGGRGRFQVRASKGIHLVVPRDRIQLDTGLILRTEKSVLFVIPWGRHWIIGTTDTDWKLSKSHPAASSSDIDYILDHLNSALVTPLSREDVEGVYAGLRPLLAGESEQTSKLSREHLVSMPVPGLVVVAGGKYTTYRVMAKDAIDRAGGSAGSAGTGLRHRRHPAAGLGGLPGVCGTGGARWRPASGLHPARIEHLLHRYGSMTPGPARAAARSGRSWPRRCPTRMTTSRWRSCTRRWPKARCISTTSSRGAPVSPSRRGTGDWPPPCRQRG